MYELVGAQYKPGYKKSEIKNYWKVIVVMKKVIEVLDKKCFEYFHFNLEKAIY